MECWSWIEDQMVLYQMCFLSIELIVRLIVSFKPPKKYIIEI